MSNIAQQLVVAIERLIQANIAEDREEHIDYDGPGCLNVHDARRNTEEARQALEYLLTMIIDQAKA